MTGVVYLVGAGPGDPGLITVRGLTLLRSADAVVHDRLVSAELLAQHRPNAEIHDVGKVPGQHGQGRQAEICDLLVGLAKKGKTVVRLKGGDPFVFGRGGEEAEACAGAGVTFEVVPGVTSPIAVPAYAGIPITHRSVASSFAVVTGHEDSARASRVRWDVMAQIDTLVILMGVESLPSIVERLTAAGRSPGTPIALISRGTYAGQRTVTGTLADIAGRARTHALKSPVTIVVGEVVQLRDRLRWFDCRPLSGRRIIVPRTREKSSVLAERFRDLGAEVLEIPRPVVEHHPDRIAPALRELRRYDVLLLTSPAAVKALQLALDASNLDARALAPIRIAAAGPGTEGALHTIGLRPDLTVASYLAAPIVDALMASPLTGRRVLLLRQAESGASLSDSLTESGFEVRDIAAYSARPDIDHYHTDPVDAVVFPSSGSVRALNTAVHSAVQRFDGSGVFCMGDQTARAAAESGWSVCAVAPAPTFDSLVESVLGALAPRKLHAGRS